MTEKIKWYKEVLELEPNSKVFFPLARLLAEDGQTEDAMLTLEQGLKRHPEYLEARLYFIELLHKSNRKDVCQTQIGELSRMFASYAGFWDAWAACLSQRPEDADTASILRFLAANFISGPLQLHDVIDRGLASVIDDARKTAGISDKAAARQSENPSMADESASEKEALQPEPAAELPDAAADTAPEVFEEETEFLVEQTEPDHEEALPAGLMPEEEPLPHAGEPVLPEPVAETELFAEPEEPVMPEEADDNSALQAKSDPALAEDAFELESVTVFELSDQTENSLEEDLARVAEEDFTVGVEDTPPLNLSPEAGPLTEDAAFDGMIDSLAEQSRELEMAGDVPPLAPENESLDEVPDNDLEGPVFADTQEMDESRSSDTEEGFSLRTRSMAEVLAEQGDIEGAIDIYRELADAAKDPIEIADINHRIATLSSRIGEPQEEFEAPAMDDRTSNKDKLIGMLEALARRVEARAQN